MKKYILLPAMMVAAMLSTTAVKAQEDVNPLLKYVNKENNLKASIGGRMFADVAYYHTEWTPMKIRCCHHGRSYSCLFNLREIVYLRRLRFREWRVQPKKPIRTIYLQRKFKRYSLGKSRLL